MNKAWDRLGHDWESSIGTTGYTDAERLPRPNFGSTRNPMCRTCRKHQRGRDRCECAIPDFDQTPATANRRMQEWHQAWATEALRVLKPGGHLLAFGGTRTYHRLACAVEDAGFEIRDTIAYMYGSGFPKSLNVGKAIDRAAGAEREVVGMNHHAAKRTGHGKEGVLNDRGPGLGGLGSAEVTAAATPEAERWEGWGTALKPAHEPVVVARKPLSGTVAATILEHGTGALNIDGARVGTEGGGSVCPGGDLCECDTDGRAYSPTKHPVRREGDFGRWPANVVLSHTEECVPVGTRKVKSSDARKADGTKSAAMGETWREGSGLRPELSKSPPTYNNPDGTETVTAYRCHPDCPVRLLDEQTGELRVSSGRSAGDPDNGIYGTGLPRGDGRPTGFGDSGGASRFMKNVDWKHEEAERRAFYCAKASRSERNAGLEGFEEAWSPTMGNGIGGKPHDEDVAAPKRNVHPTVKPISLMRWLVRLVTPPEGTVLDPFCGSGSTGCAAVLEGFDFLGLEREPEYVEIAEARIAWWHKHRGDGEAAEILAAGEARDEVEATGQLDMFG